MSTPTLSQSVTIGEDVVFRELDGEAVILNMDSGIYFGLDAVGTRIWRLIEEHASLQKILEVMREEFDTTPGVLQRDLLAFVGQMLDKGLVRIAPAP